MSNNIKTIEEIPKDTHLAAMVFKTESIYHEGDERSKQCPGHGYPAHTETIHTIEYIPFKDKTELDEWVTKTEQKPAYGYDSKPKYKLVEVRPLTPKLKLNITLE